MEGNQKKGLFNVRKFRFENEQINKWMDTGGNIEYYYEVRENGILPLNQNDGLLSFTFHLEMNPIGEIKFNGDCILFSTILENLIQILKAKKDSEIRKRNEPFINALNKLLLKRCLDHSKEIGEREGLHFHNYDFLLNQLGLEHVSFKNEGKRILELKGNNLIPKNTIANINNINDKINQFAQKENIDLEKIKERLEKYHYKHIAHFPKPVIYRNLTINGVYYDKLIFNDAIVYSKEKVPPTCLYQPKIYKISILEYDPKNKTAKLFVKKRN